MNWGQFIYGICVIRHLTATQSSFSQLGNSGISTILCEIPTADYCSNGKILKLDKEITKAKMLKYVIMNCSCEFFTHNNTFYAILRIIY